MSIEFSTAPVNRLFSPLTQVRSAMAVLALLAGAAILMTHPAAQYSLWYDEAWSALAVRGHDAGEVLEIVRGDFHPPIYFLALDVWSAATGFSEFALRFPSILSSLFTAAVAYRLATDLYRSRTPAIFAVLVLVSMPFYIRFALETRMYALLSTLATASMWLLWRYLNRPTRGLAVSYVLTTTLALYVQYLTLFILPLQMAYVVLWFVGAGDRRQATRVRQALLLPGVSFALLLPWLPVFFAQLNSPDYVLLHNHALPSNFDTISNTLVEDFFAGQTILYLILTVLACLRLDRDRGWRLRLSDSRATGLLFVWGIGWLTLVWGTNLVVPQFQPRNALPALPVLAILVGRGLSRLPRLVGVGLVAVLIVGNLNGYDTYQAHDPHYRDAVEVLAAGYQPGDRVLVQTNTYLHDLPLQHYLNILLPPHLEPIWLNALPGVPGTDAFRRAIADAIGENKRVWFLQTLPVDNRWVGQALPHREISNVHVDAFQIVLYEAP